MVRFFILLLFTSTLLFILTGQTNRPFAGRTTTLPQNISQHADSLRRADNLTEWLYTYIDYIDTDPVKLIPLLADAMSGTWRTCSTDAERQVWFKGLAKQGYYFLYGGNILRSVDAYEQAYRYYSDNPVPGTDLLEYVLKPLGNNYTRLGDYDRAFYIQKKSLALAQQNDTLQIASICHNLATTAIWKDDLALARYYCETGLKVTRQNAAIKGLLLSTLAEIFLKSKNITAAEPTITRAIKILHPQLANKDEPNVAYWLMEAYQKSGDILKEKKEFNRSLQAYQNANAIIDNYYKGQRKREKAKLLVLSANILVQLDQPEKALTQYNAALSLLIPLFKPQNIYDVPSVKDVYGENTLLDALHGKGDCLNNLDKKAEALQSYMLLFDVERKLRHEFFSSTARQQQQKENRLWVESALSTAYDLWKANGQKEYADKVLLIAEMSKAQLLLDEMMSNLEFNRIKTQDTVLNRQQRLMQAIAFYERETIMDNPDSAKLASKNELQYQLSLVQKQVKEKYPVLGGYNIDDETPAAESLLHAIPAQTAIAEFFTGQKNYYIIEATNGGIQQISKLEHAPVLHQEVKDFVDNYFQHGPQKMMNDPGGYYRDAYRLFRLLPIINPGKKEQCIIIPDGIIGYLPFDALVTDSAYTPGIAQWPFLIKKNNLFYNYSLQTFLQQKKIKHSNRSFAGFFVSFDSSSQALLPAVKKEEESIEKNIKGDFFKEQNASLKEFNTQLAKVNLLHISTHSFFQGKDNIPVLQLADDKFFLFELPGKTFLPQLVVLSACRTGHGLLAEGEGIISLARGFTAGGVGGIVAGLWNMNDESTANLMGNFYGELSGNPQPASALHAAKLQWIEEKKENEFQKLPYFWAGMVYYGDNEPVNIEIKKSTPVIFWLLLAAAVLLSGTIVQRIVTAPKKRGYESDDPQINL
jgi:tetratricopeptide (TPR) repeat protein